ncbi:MAG: trypsin-like peptidase domain-containing protein [Candidatus Liptonbacteria bacterium]|nr:trypsin-like peptidase domain-containing protein [Candidatus Liptonbacteria bacterium]
MNNNNLNKKLIAVLVTGIVLGVISAPVFKAQLAKANFFDDIWNNFVSPFNPSSSSAVPKNVQEQKAQTYQPPLDYERAVIDAVKKASPAVVSITVSKYVPIIEQCPYNPFDNLPQGFQQFFGDRGNTFYTPCDTGKKELQEIGGGSGFIISSNGLILTNKHVVSDQKASYTVFTNDGKKYSATVLARDPVQDLAVVKIEAENLPTIELGDSDQLELGQTAIAIGNALGEYRNTVSTGVISGLSRTVTAGGAGFGQETIQGVIQTDAAINPGNSGGPLLNLRGQVVGINTAMASGAQSIGFAIPINRAKKDIESVKASGEIQAAFLGVRYIAVTPDMAKKEKLAVDYGALLRGSSDGPAVQSKSPADRAGLKAKDIILEVDGKKLDSDNLLGDVISQKNVGQSITLKINRDGKEVTVTATLEKRP